MRLKFTLTGVTINVLALAFGNESKTGNLESEINSSGVKDK